MSPSDLPSPPAVRTEIPPFQAALSATGREQQRLAQTLHDTVCQSLNGVHLLASVLARKLHASQAETAGEASELCRLLKDAAGELHELAASLGSADLEGRGLAHSLEQMARTVEPRMACETRCDATITLSDHPTAEHLYQIAREAVGNALAHSGASRLEITLSRQPSGEVLLVVQDDGRGIQQAPAAEERITGLEMARYRAALIGARLEIASEQNLGTIVTCRLPPRL